MIFIQVCVYFAANESQHIYITMLRRISTAKLFRAKFCIQAISTFFNFARNTTIENDPTLFYFARNNVAVEIRLKYKHKAWFRLMRLKYSHTKKIIAPCE